MIKFILTGLLLVLTTATAHTQTSVKRGLRAIDLNLAKSQMEFLSSDALQGRLMGTPFAQITAQYIISQLSAMGYHPQVQTFTAREMTLNNVLVTIPGRDTTQCVIIGAHYDHLGVAPDGDVYNGADDNASGVVGLLQLAAAIKASESQPQKSIILAFWDGEERGLNGSKHYVSTYGNTPNIKCYMNFDLIGRNTDPARAGLFRYFYSDTNVEFRDYLDRAIDRYRLASLEPDYRAVDKTLGGSDNASFGRQGVPIIWYHTDGHADFHKPSDTADKINWTKMMDIIRSAYVVSWNIANY